MGVILKFIVFLLAGVFFLTLLLGAKTVGRLFQILFGPRRPSSYDQRQQSRQERTNAEPETQEDRIISYQKKNFESSPAEDVEFEEIKK